MESTVEFKKAKSSGLYQLESVAGSVIQASGRLVIVDGLRLRPTAAFRYTLSRRPR